MPSLLLGRNAEINGKLNRLPSSKSISNRTLILNALSGNLSRIHNLSSSTDTQRMRELLHRPEKKINVMDTGTAMRFLIAYFTVTGQHKVLTGTAEMQQRPIGLLVDTLRVLGGTIIYNGASGFPPVEVSSFEDRHVAEVVLFAGVSSQYISALMMVAPLLHKGLTIRMEGKVSSLPYIEMTASLMESFGVTCTFRNGRIYIPAMAYKPAEIAVEADWSSISYWLALTSLAEKANIRLMGVSPHSIQGDCVIVDIMDKLGVGTVFQHGDAVLFKQEKTVKVLEWDFSPCPDLAQTVFPVCALKGIGGRFYGLENLRYKETDRILALQTELAKVGAKLIEESQGVFVLYPSPRIDKKKKVQIATYHDHRMAMGFAPWATMLELEIENPAVVKKSYPQFWTHLGALGFSMQKKAI